LKVNLIIPMAGLGTRYTERGYVKPKPLIEVAGKPMFVRAVDSMLKITQPIQLIFCVLREHEKLFQISNTILAHYPTAEIVIIEEVTSGPLETLTIGARGIRNSYPVISTDCDQEFICEEFRNFLSSDNESVDLAFLFFRAESPSFSFVKLDSVGKVIKVAEKDPISPFAICSTYFIESTHKLFRFWEQIARTDKQSEKYLSQLAQTYLEHNLEVVAFELDSIHIYGTPDSLETAERYSR
jgi:dTDP-glucose pyrophosphorylase